MKMSLKRFDSIYFRDKSHFQEDRTQNYLVCQPMYQYFKSQWCWYWYIYIHFWKSKGLSDEIITAPTTSDYSINPKLSNLGNKTRLKVKGSFLMQDKGTYSHGKILNIYINYELDKICIKTSPTVVTCLFGAVSLTKNNDNDKEKYSGYGIGFDREDVYSFGNGFGRNVIIFGANMSSCFHVGNKRKDILILGKGPTQGLGEH